MICKVKHFRCIQKFYTNTVLKYYLYNSHKSSLQAPSEVQIYPMSKYHGVKHQKSNENVTNTLNSLKSSKF